MKNQKKNLLLRLLIILSFQNLAAQEIVRTSNPNGWILKTNNSAYQMVVSNDNKVKQVFYGAIEQADFQQKNTTWTDFDEVPVRGGTPFKTPIVEILFSNEARDLDIFFDSYEIIEDGGISLLKIIQKDRHYPLEIISFFKVYKEYDIIEKWITITNKDDKNSFLIENLLSGGFALPHDNYIQTSLVGDHMNEFQIEQSPITVGTKVISSKAFKTNQLAPWFMLANSFANDSHGDVWYGTIHYSGNWSFYFDKSFSGRLQVAGGINFWDTNWTLLPGQSFTTPKISFGYSGKGSDMASLNLSGYVKQHILPLNFRNEIRPVLYNSWEATYYDVNENQQIELANIAKEIGVELFVMDDGWFKERTDGRSQSGLGNFDVDTNKFPNGLKPLIDHVHGLGMKFGLWVEPENVNPNSDVYREHPEWIFQYPNYDTNKFRKSLNLANEDAYNHLLNSLTVLLKENNIDFIKWDQNNYLLDPGWVNAPNGLEREVRLRHVNNIYRLLEELRKRFPDVLFETCASGGGRVDLGILSRMDQAWVSDNTDPLDRLFIQHGYAKMLPANTMVSWVTSMTRNNPVTLEYRFDVSMMGVLGIGANITKWNDQEKKIATKKIEQYKNIRPIIQKGDYYSLASPFEINRTAAQYISLDNDSCLVFCFNLAHYLKGSQIIDRIPKNIQLKNLDVDAMYTVMDYSANKQIGTFRGGFLMKVGLKWPLENRSFNSKILLLIKVKE